MAARRFLVPPPVWFAAALGLQHLVARDRRPTKASIATSVALVGGAGALAISAVAAFHRNGTTIDPEHPERASALVADGPLAFTRNPMYLGLTGALVAHAMLRRSAAALVPVAGFVAVIDRVQIPVEERALRVRFGRRYDRYRRAVPRWVGVPGR